MKWEAPTCKRIEQQFGDTPEEILHNLYKHIELCGRVSYKSEDKITDTSAESFVNRIYNLGHLSVLEHGTIYLTGVYNGDSNSELFDIELQYSSNKYSKVVSKTVDNKLLFIYITTNLRVVKENHWEDSLKYISTPSLHAQRTTFKFDCSIGLSREFNRHRVNSITEMSTRYCNFSKDKFANEITYIAPEWMANKDSDSEGMKALVDNMAKSEETYMKLLSSGWKPQEARCVLPLATKTEMYHTAFNEDWKHFCQLRCAEGAHPEAKELARIVDNTLFPEE